MTGSQEYYGKTAEVRRNDYLTDATDYEGENHSILAGVIRLLDEIPNGEYDVSGWSHDVGAMVEIVAIEGEYREITICTQASQDNEEARKEVYRIPKNRTFLACEINDTELARIEMDDPETADVLKSIGAHVEAAYGAYVQRSRPPELI